MYSIEKTICFQSRTVIGFFSLHIKIAINTTLRFIHIIGIIFNHSCKKIMKKIFTDVLDEIRKELQAMALCRHPNIISHYVSIISFLTQMMGNFSFSTISVLKTDNNICNHILPLFRVF